MNGSAGVQSHHNNLSVWENSDLTGFNEDQSQHVYTSIPVIKVSTRFMFFCHFDGTFAKKTCQMWRDYWYISRLSSPDSRKWWRHCRHVNFMYSHIDSVLYHLKSFFSPVTHNQERVAPCPYRFGSLRKQMSVLNGQWMRPKKGMCQLSISMLPCFLLSMTRNVT